MSNEAPLPAPMQQETTQNPISIAPTVIQHPPSHVHMYNLREDELSELSAPNLAISFGLFTLCVGLAVTCLVVLQTVENLSDREHASFLAATIAFSGLAALTGIAAARDYVRVRGALTRIRQRDPRSL
jgi:hypothetical protein